MKTERKKKVSRTSKELTWFSVQKLRSQVSVPCASFQPGANVYGWVVNLWKSQQSYWWRQRLGGHTAVTPSLFHVPVGSAIPSRKGLLPSHRVCPWLLFYFSFFAPSEKYYLRVMMNGLVPKIRWEQGARPEEPSLPGLRWGVGLGLGSESGCRRLLSPGSFLG